MIEARAQVVASEFVSRLNIGIFLSLLRFIETFRELPKPYTVCQNLSTQVAYEYGNVTDRKTAGPLVNPLLTVTPT